LNQRGKKPIDLLSEQVMAVDDGRLTVPRPLRQCTTCFSASSPGKGRAQELTCHLQLMTGGGSPGLVSHTPGLPPSAEDYSCWQLERGMVVTRHQSIRSTNPLNTVLLVNGNWFCLQHQCMKAMHHTCPKQDAIVFQFPW
jgi:hypothetical protein